MLSLRLDVFGREVVAEQSAGRWVLYVVGPEGKRRPAKDMLVPEFVVSEKALIDYLNDLCHEMSTPERPTVRRID